MHSAPVSVSAINCAVLGSCRSACVAARVGMEAVQPHGLKQPCVLEAVALCAGGCSPVRVRAAVLCTRACVTPASLKIVFHSSGS